MTATREPKRRQEGTKKKVHFWSSSLVSPTLLYPRCPSCAARNHRGRPPAYRVRSTNCPFHRQFLFSIQLFRFQRVIFSRKSLSCHGPISYQEFEADRVARL